MSTRTVTLPTGEVIRIRPYRPDDRDQVIRIFSEGMTGLAQRGWRHLLHNSTPMQVLSCTLPAAALLVTPNRCGLLGKAAAGLGAAAIVPCFVFGVLRRALKRYVTDSVKGPDLSGIETFYSAAGAGQGSAFWVAELFEQEPATTAPDSAPLLTQREAQSSSVNSPEARAIPASELTDQPLSPPGAPEEQAAAAFAAAAQPTPPSAVDAAGDPHANGGARAQGDEKKDHASKSTVTPHSGDGDGRCGTESADDKSVRELVAGLVAAAVARLEGAPSSSPRPKSPTTSQAPGEKPLTIAPSSGGGGGKDALTHKHLPGGGPTAVAAAVAAVATAMSGPVTPSATAQRPCTFVDPPPPSQVLPAALKAAAAGSESGQGGAAAPTAAAAPPPPAARRGTIIGHVALERKSWQLAELRRMSVLRQYSGSGVGGLLLETLVVHAREVGFRELMLYTSGMQKAARRLYERGGWRVTKTMEMQGVDVYQYTLDLTKKR